MEYRYFNFYDILSLFGGFLALLLGCIFIFNEKFRTKSNFASAISLFSVFLIVLKNILSSLPLAAKESLMVYLPLFYILLIPLGFYYSIIFLLNPSYQFKRKDYWLLSPIILLAIGDFVFLFLYLFYPELLKEYPNSRRWYGDFLINTVSIVYFVIVSIISWKKINQYQKQLLNNYSFIEGRDLEWLRNTIKFIFFILLIFLVLRVSLSYFPVYKMILFYLMWILTTAFMCLTAFNIIINQNFYLVPQFKNKKESPVLPKALSEKTDDHYQVLLELMQKEKLYQDAELNMDTLSAKLELSKGYLSRIINQKEGKNFYDFVNTFRVAEVKNNLNNPDFAHYSILGIGLAAGFKSKSTFNTVFKKMTHLTPSGYKKSLK